MFAVSTPLRAEIRHFRLARYAGEYVPGAVPVEIVVGGDGYPTRVLRPGDAEWPEAVEDERLGREARSY